MESTAYSRCGYVGKTVGVAGAAKLVVGVAVVGGDEVVVRDWQQTCMHSIHSRTLNTSNEIISETCTGLN